VKEVGDNFISKKLTSDKKGDLKMTYTDCRKSKFLKKMGTVELEVYIEFMYESEASQEELDFLETIFAERISEEDLNITEEDPNMSEEIGINGGNLELGLIEMYRRYLQPDGKRDGLMTKKETIQCMRGYLEDAGLKSAGLKDVTDSQILAAAKDVYEYKKNLIKRYKSKNKISNLPDNYCVKR